MLLWETVPGPQEGNPGTRNHRRVLTAGVPGVPAPAYQVEACRVGVSSGSGGHSERQALCKGLPRPEHLESPQLCGTMGLARRTGNVVKNGQASFIRPPSLHGSIMTHLSGLVGGSKMGLGTHQLPSYAVQTHRPSLSEKPSHFQLPSHLPLPRLVFWALLVTTSWDVGVD